jgi:hypothetical protein
LVAIFLVQSFCASLQKSPVYDEPAHIASGMSYLATGVFHANLQHPPLLKEMSAAWLWMAGIHWPETPLAAKLIQGGPAAKNLEWPIGSGIIQSNGPDRVMFWARLPFILLGGLLGALIYIWGREIAGEQAALLALFLYAFDPIVIAHSYLVTTDVGMAAFTVLFVFTLWRYVQSPGRLRLVWCGLALGALLGSKFSAVAMLPVGAVLLLAAMWRNGGPAEPAAEVGPNSPCPCGSGKKYKKCHGSGDRVKVAAAPPKPGTQAIVKAGVAFLAMLGIAAVVIEALYLFSSNPFLYLEGLRQVNADHAAGHGNYLHGVVGDRSPIYFAVAYLLKEPLAAVLVACIGWVVLLRNKSMPLVSKLFLVLPPLVLFVAYTIGADQWGVRYIIPTLPFAFLAGGIGLAALLRIPSAWARVAAAVLCLWTVVEAAGIYPDHLSYFNEMACVLENPGRIGLDGGSRCGPLWLDDSNVDWGQGLKQLKSWLDAQGEKRTIRLYYFGSLPPDAYGLKYENRPAAELLRQPAPGLSVVSAHFVARLPALGAPWVRRLQPKAIVGHAFYIYDMPDKAAISR